MDRPSAAGTVTSLIADLLSERPVVRETALARLTVIGARAVVHLIALAVDAGAPAASRVAALRALEAIGDVRAIDAAKQTLNTGDKSVGVAAAGVLQRFLSGKRGADVADALSAKALDAQAPDAIRLAALVALEGLGAPALQPLWQALARDSSASVQAHVADARDGRSGEIPSDATGTLVDDPEAVRRELSLNRASRPPSELHSLLVRIRTREESEAGTARDAWTRARGAAHVALARRGSRLGVYDLRESLEKSGAPLSVEFMAALAIIGDTTCLESIAAAYAHAPAKQDDWWRDHLVDAFRAIVKREKLTARHAVMKKIQKRWPAILTTA